MDGSSSFALRRATIADVHEYWRVNNQPAVRRNAVHSDPIPFESHRRWFERALTSAERLLFVGVRGEEVVATLRFDLAEPRVWTITIAVSSESRGRGVGRKLLAMAFDVLPRSASRILAEVRPENEASQRLFQRAGYAAIGRVSREGVELDRLELARGAVE